MAIVQANWNPTTRQLRQFGGLCLVALPLVGWLWSASSTVIMILVAFGVVVALASWLYPRAVQPLFVGLMLITTPIGMIIGELAMVLIYVAVLLPIGILFRIVARDRLQLKLDRQATSYWQAKRKPESVASYYRQS